MGDDASYASPSFDDSSWESYVPKANIILPKGEHFFWMRKTIQIPQELLDGEEWFGFEKISAAFEVYADGMYIGSHGTFPPAERVRTEITDMMLIPSSCIHDGTVSIAMRVSGPMTQVTYIDVTLGNSSQARFTNEFRSIFNQRIFIIMSTLCLFICFYAFSQFIGDRKTISNLMYAGALLFIGLYFYDLGTETLVFSYSTQRVIARSSLPVSMNFLLLFIMTFFNKKYAKRWTIALLIANPVDFILYSLCYGNGQMTDLLFLVFLLPIFSVIVYGIVVTTRELKKHTPDTLPLFIGFIVGSLFGVHDIICMIVGYIPFMWLQGFSFFCLNIAIFITISSRASRLKKEFEQLASVSSTQRDKLESLFVSAKKLSSETNEIVASLNSSVGSVANASSQTAEKVTVISNAIATQNAIREETAAAINNFANSLTSMGKELEQEASTITTTVNETSAVLQGIDTVGKGLSTAVAFSTSLTALTRTGTNDMHSLSDAMDRVQSSSAEILSVANALDDFAQQTDLLAMNASIEAAHAGEAGKGFAVIAHEIKSLASASSQRSAKIGEIVQSISDSVERSVELVEKVNSALEKIQSGALQSAQTITSASEGMKVQQISGARIAKESSTLAQSADRMKQQAASQSEISTKVLSNMNSLSNAANLVDKANAEISHDSQQLAEQAHSLTLLAERTKHASEELALLMSN